MALLDDPLILRDAIAYDYAHKWEDAMHDKYESLMANGTLEFTTLPNNRTHIGCKWMFHAKRDALGHVLSYKQDL